MQRLTRRRILQQRVATVLWPLRTVLWASPSSINYNLGLTGSLYKFSFICYAGMFIVINFVIWLRFTIYVRARR